MKVLRLITNATNLLALADPAARSTTFSIDQSTAPKKAGQRTVLNAKTTFTSRQISALPAMPGCESTCSSDTEVISIKTTISGSIENRLKVTLAVQDHLYNLALAYPDAVIGFINRTAAYAIETQVE